MSTCYNEDFKRQVVQDYMKGLKSTAEYNIAKSTVSEWAKKYSEECQYTTRNNDSDSAREIRKLNQELREKEKEIVFLKKAVAFFAKEID